MRSNSLNRGRLKNSSELMGGYLGCFGSTLGTCAQSSADAGI
jgi:hypothetical protein